MDSMTVERLDKLDLVDQYREALVEVVEAKAEHREPKTIGDEETAPAGQVVDLMAALEQSVQDARAARGETSGKPGTVHAMPKAKKAAAKKKAPAKKPAAKKTPAKKPSRRKSA
ncbi:hypothetical protein ABZZ37_18600 [Streptomyces sp. NPDC006464]|uniref:hypothetical protein n=1 Tax=unclassified Streptomyces TaxID=2593676 RepID=UPI0033BDC76A